MGTKYQSNGSVANNFQDAEETSFPNSIDLFKLHPGQEGRSVGPNWIVFAQPNQQVPSTG